MGLTERNLFWIGSDAGGIAERLGSIDDKLRELSTKMARIKKAPGIEPPKPPAEEKYNAQSERHYDKRCN
jgi:hypothetical protein